jgi:hypothetical protein
MRPIRFSSRARRFAFIASLLGAAGCEENLPNGPNTFAATLRIKLASDTLVVGATRTAEAEAVDAAGNVIQSLSYSWTSADSTILGFSVPASPSPDVSAGRATTLLGRRAGRSVLTLSLPDSRFVVNAATRTQTVVVGGVRILSTHDSTLTSINDTAVAIAASLTMVNGQLVTRPSQGIRWIHLGVRTTVAGQGDTVRYIARANGADTLIATHDFCLAGAKCADTLIARVSQLLLLSVTPRTFLSWSFADSLAPTVTLADRRGVGQAGTSIRFVPASAADSAVVRVTGIVGSSNPSNGLMATPRMVSQGNGSAIVRVVAVGSDGSTIATDSVTATVRQVARRVNVEPLRAVLTETDSIPILPVARDARGGAIADATVTIAGSDLPLHGGWAGPRSDITTTTLATITPAITGIALPENNPLAPQIAPFIDAAAITVVPLDTVKAGSATKNRTVSTTVFDSSGAAAVGTLVRIRVTGGTATDPVTVDFNGTATVTWTPPDVAGNYTLTGTRATTTGLATLADSAGRIVMRRSVVVIATDPDASQSTVAVSPGTIAMSGTATVSITVRDIFGNIVKTVTSTSVSATASGGTIGAFSCVNGVCTATYTPTATGTFNITAQVGGVNVSNNPAVIVVQ